MVVSLFVTIGTLSQPISTESSINTVNEKTVSAVQINFEKDQEGGDVYTIKSYARKPDDIHVPTIQKSRKKHIPNIGHEGKISRGYKKTGINRRIHQDNTKPR